MHAYGGDVTAYGGDITAYGGDVIACMLCLNIIDRLFFH